MRGFEPISKDYLLIFGRPRLTLFLIILTFVSLFLTFNILYDSAVYSIEAGSYEDNEISIVVDEKLKMVLVNRSRIDDGISRIHDISRVHFPRTSRRLPQAIIIGVRKCGTRALLEMLFLHPMVQKAAGEVHFFDRDENYNKGLDWYRKKMPHSFRGQITIEKSPSYFVTPEVPERIRAMNTSVKLLLIVREPVTRTISDYTQLRSHAATASSTMTTSPLQQKSFEELVMLRDGSINQSYRPLAISLYHTYLHRWLEVFERQQLLVVNGDLLIKDPVPELQKIETFLGLEHRITRNNFYFNHTKGFYCLRNDTADKCLRETKGRKHPRVSPIVVTKLRQFFSEHNQRFYELVGEDMGWPEQ